MRYDDTTDFFIANGNQLTTVIFKRAYEKKQVLTHLNCNYLLEVCDVCADKVAGIPVIINHLFWVDCAFFRSITA